MNRSAALDKLYPPFRKRLLVGLQGCQNAGYLMELFETFRTYERQAYLYTQGRSIPGKIVTRARAGLSWHNYGVAADIALKINDEWKWTPQKAFFDVAPFFQKEGLYWLGRDPKFLELVHYQLPGPIDIFQAQKLYEHGGLKAVWDEFDKQYKGEL